MSSNIHAVYAMHHLETGVILYQTTATEEEIQQANQNLKNCDQPYRFFPPGDFSIPSLHRSDDLRLEDFSSINP
jgi:hypothetical protein